MCYLKLIFFLASLFGCMVVSDCSNRLFLKFYENATDSRLVCNDGSPGGYYIRESPTDEGKNKWIFHQQGGGWCYDHVTCAERLLNNALPPGGSVLVSSKNWPASRDLDGIFDMDGTDFSSANLVYLPYCSSDAHMADTETHLPGYGTFQMRGRRMAHNAVQTLVGPNKQNQLVLFGGCSAGGRGSMVTIDALRELLHPSTVLRGLHDSGAYQDIPVYPGVISTSFGEQCRRAYQYYNQPETNKKCSDMYPDELWKCLCGEYMLPLVETPSQIHIFQYDSYQLTKDLGYFGRDPSHWTEEMCVYVEETFRKGMLNTLKALSSPTSPHVVFGPACYHHCLTTDPTYWRNVTVNGVSAESQLFAWFNNVKLDGVSSCNGVNCEESCPHVDISPAATNCIKQIQKQNIST